MSRGSRPGSSPVRTVPCIPIHSHYWASHPLTRTNRAATPACARPAGDSRSAGDRQDVCGIAGVRRFDGAPVGSDLLAAMGRTLHLRTPGRELGMTRPFELSRQAPHENRSSANRFAPVRPAHPAPFEGKCQLVCQHGGCRRLGAAGLNAGAGSSIRAAGVADLPNILLFLLIERLAGVSCSSSCSLLLASPPTRATP